MKPYYNRNGITIYCGDCLDLMPEILKNDSIDLTVTSPPYDKLREYNGYSFDFEPIAGEVFRVTKSGGVVVWVVGDQTVNGSETCTSDIQKLYFKSIGFNVHDTMIYETDKPPLPSNRYQPCFEFMFVFSKGKPKTFNPLKISSTHAGSYRGSRMYRQSDNKLKPQWGNGIVKPTKIKTSIWYYPSGMDKGIAEHPATFPQALARDHIKSWSNPDDIILDPMMGSGTVLKMCVEFGRRAIGIEISEEYCKVAVERLRQPSFFSLPTNGNVKSEPQQIKMDMRG